MAGVYHFDVAVAVDATSFAGLSTLKLNINGNSHREALNPSRNSGTVTLNISTNLKLAKGDKVTLALFLQAEETTRNLYWGSRYSYFAGNQVY
ncbi:hypothetical protein D3C79_1001080 [compost metagenome]